MKIHIKNCGAIGDGVIDLSKPITLLCGENGTGKTYFSYMIYGLLNARFHIKSEEHIIEELINDRAVEFSLDFSKIISYRRTMLENTKENLDLIFGISSEEAKKIFDGLEISFDDSDDDAQKVLHAASIERIATIQGIKVSLKKAKETDVVRLEILNKDVPADALSGFSFVLFSFVYYCLALYPLSGVEVFPVERNSIYTFSKELSIRKQEALDNLQLLIDKDKKVSKFDLFFNSKRYPWPIRDGLMVAEDLVEKKKNKSPFYDFAQCLETELLHGRVQISNDGEIQFKPLKSLRTVLPIQMTASVVKTLSSLVVYLKHIAHKNDLIIIDEPEINLHPDNQILIARILARLANKGFRLLVSTHSDYIIREFNNMVMLSQIEDREDVLKRLDYNSDETIIPSDLGVYVFKYQNKKSRKVNMNSVEVADTGFAIESIDKAIDKQNDVAEELYYTLKYSKSKK